jgi:hypothetical protein
MTIRSSETILLYHGRLLRCMNRSRAPVNVFVGVERAPYVVQVLGASTTVQCIWPANIHTVIVFVSHVVSTNRLLYVEVSVAS